MRVNGKIRSEVKREYLSERKGTRPIKRIARAQGAAISTGLIPVSGRERSLRHTVRLDS